MSSLTAGLVKANTVCNLETNSPHMVTVDSYVYVLGQILDTSDLTTSDKADDCLLQKDSAREYHDWIYKQRLCVCV